jgi:hypothetical protein
MKLVGAYGGRRFQLSDFAVHRHNAPGQDVISSLLSIIAFAMMAMMA